MPLHEDDPNRPGNLTDEEYRAVSQALIDEHGDAGLHIIPDDVLAAAVRAAEAWAGEPDDDTE
jgi:hypothetical protein